MINFIKLNRPISLPLTPSHAHRCYIQSPSIVLHYNYILPSPSPSPNNNPLHSLQLFTVPQLQIFSRDRLHRLVPCLRWHHRRGAEETKDQVCPDGGQGQALRLHVLDKPVRVIKQQKLGGGKSTSNPFIIQNNCCVFERISQYIFFVSIHLFCFIVFFKVTWV